MQKMKFDLIVQINSNLNNETKAHIELIKLYNELGSKKGCNILLDFSGIYFLSANLLALLGCCVDSIISSDKNQVSITHLHPKIKVVMQKNGFNRYFTWEDKKDVYHSTMSYRIFAVNTDNLGDFERYLLLNIFNRKELPIMNPCYKDRIVDNFLEIFNNVIDHADSSAVYVCGQYFHKSSNLSFTIVDLGKTIKSNVTSYLAGKSIFVPDNTLDWAVLPGNSTKPDDPGGLGFSIIIDFLEHNKGSLILISDDEIYELNNGKKRSRKMEVSFPGTVVTITINLKDQHLYFLDKDNDSIIIF